MDPVISLRGIGKVFGAGEAEVHALRGIDLDVRHGEYVAVTGPSGSGKSALLAVMGLLDTASGGTYSFLGHRVEDLGAAARDRLRNTSIGIVFRSFQLIAELTVFENVELPLAYAGASRRQRRGRVLEVLERVGLGDRASARPWQLSSGQKQGVAIARALVARPAVLLADEPTGNLHSASGETVMELLRELHQGGSTICLATHDPRLAARAGRRVHLLDGRRLDPESVEATERPPTR